MTHPRRTRYIGRERERDLAHASDFTIKRARSSDPGVFECGRGGLPFAMQTITQRIARKRAHRHTKVPANGTGYRTEREREEKREREERRGRNRQKLDRIESRSEILAISYMSTAFSSFLFFFSPFLSAFWKREREKEKEREREGGRERPKWRAGRGGIE